jgi:hypothetical protein
LNAEERDDLVLAVAEGGDGKKVPERTAILSVVHQHSLDLFAGVEGFADLSHGHRVSLGAL